MTLSTRVSGTSLTGTRHELQDTWGYEHGGPAWVIDGVTSPTPDNEMDVIEYVGRLSRGIRKAYRKAPHEDLKGILAEAILYASEHTGSYRGTATVAMAQWNGAGVDWLVLGDSSVLFDDDISGPILVSDRRLRDIIDDLGFSSRSQEAIASGDAVEFERIRTQANEVAASLRNRKGGHWIAGDDPEAAYKAISGSTGATSIVLMTDGVGEEVETELGGAGAACKALSGNPYPVVSELREKLVPSRHYVDDMTAVSAQWIDVGSGG